MMNGDLRAARAGKNADGRVRTHGRAAAFLVDVVLLLVKLQSREGGPGDDADAFGIFICQSQFRVLQREVGSDEAEVREPIHASRLFAAEPLFGMKIFNLAGDLATAVGFVELRGTVDTRDAGDDVFPEIFQANANGSDGANSRDHHAALDAQLHQ